MGNHNDDDLMALYQRGDTAAFNSIYSHYSEALLKYISHNLHYLAPALLSDAEDILQNVFCFLHKYRDRFIPGSSLEAWLFTTADRQLLNHVEAATRKRRNIHRTRRLRLARDYDEGVTDETDDERTMSRKHRATPQPSYLVSIENAEEEIAALRRKVEHYMAALSSNQLKVIQLSYFEGRTAKQIAEEMNVPKTTVDWWKREAIARMRTLPPAPGDQ
jgi:RNA polymerase sigma factor (sigma-70 family)